jgi:ubiquinone/menaquinone biosynthesis C-methylase UbiE
MDTAHDSMDDVRRRFSNEDAAGKWHRMYESETELLDEANYRERRDVAVACVLSLLGNGERVLDLGCGAGPVLLELRRRGIQAAGLDYSEDMLANARQRLRDEGLDDGELIHGDCRHTPWPDASFDVIVCLGVISYVEHYEAILNEIARLLKPGGSALISFRNVFNPILSDPLASVRFVARRLLTPILGRVRPEPFIIGRFMDHREVTRQIEARGLKRTDFYGIGLGPFRLAGRPLFSEKLSIRLSRKLSALAGRLHLKGPLRWLADVSLWVYRKPG